MANKFDPQRLRQLELLLRWEGRIGNARLRNLFNISSIRASQWLREFRDQHPDWAVWDSVSRTFNATWDFHRTKNRDNTGSMAEYLALTGLSPTNAAADEDDVVMTAYYDTFTPEPQIFSTITTAARLGYAVEIKYRSMSEPLLHTHIIYPHSVVRAGRRWHVRAYCGLKQRFSDFTLRRISKATLLHGTSPVAKQDDTAWNTEVQVRLVAHPALSEEQADVIRAEYFHDTSAYVATCRGALVNYFVQDMRAAIDAETQRPPEYQLAVYDVDKIRQWLFPGR